jgi:hypothetical protein
MAGEVRITFFFEDFQAVRHVGWSEIIWLNTTGGDLLAAVETARVLATLRAQLLGPGYQLSVIRASKEGVFRDSRVLQVNYTGKPGPFSPSGEEGDFASSAVLIRMEADDKDRRQMWLSGAPDSLQTINSNITDPDWLQKFKKWGAEITGQYAYFGLTKDAATNKAPKKTLNPTPPPKYVVRPMQLYNITKVILREYSTRKRGRPFDLYRGRRSPTKTA